MFSLIRSLSLPLLSLASLFLATGLYNTFFPVFLEIQGFGIEEIGVLTALLYVGILVGSILLPRFIEKVGYVGSLAIFSLVSALFIILQPLWIHMFFWGFLRFGMGVCSAGVFIALESWFLIESAPTERNSALSLYLIGLYGSLSLGQFLIHFVDVHTFSPFWLTAFLSALAALPVFFAKAKGAFSSSGEKGGLSLLSIFRVSPIGVIGGVISGMILSTIHGIIPLYGIRLGLELSEVAILMAIIISGGLTLQWPIARWADLGNRRLALSGSCLFTALFSFLIATFDTHSLPTLAFMGGIFGGFAFTIYPLSMASLCEKFKTEQIVAVTGGFILAYGMGAILGPILAPFAMYLLGNGGLFYFLAFISTLLGTLNWFFALQKKNTE